MHHNTRISFVMISYRVCRILRKQFEQDIKSRRKILTAQVNLRKRKNRWTVSVCSLQTSTTVFSNESITLNTEMPIITMATETKLCNNVTRKKNFVFYQLWFLTQNDQNENSLIFLVLIYILMTINKLYRFEINKKYLTAKKIKRNSPIQTFGESRLV